MSRLDSLLTLQLLMVITAGTDAYGQPKQTFTAIDFPGAAGTAHLRRWPEGSEKLSGGPAPDSHRIWLANL